jgi:hypothetical protein
MAELAAISALDARWFSGRCECFSLGGLEEGEYLRECMPGHARRLRDMAWLPLLDGFPLDRRRPVAWERPAVTSRQIGKRSRPWTSGQTARRSPLLPPIPPPNSRSSPGKKTPPAGRG